MASSHISPLTSTNASDITERESFILDQLATRGEISVGELSESLGLSAVTIRHTLHTMEEHGYLVRTHGGARPTAFKNIHLRQNDRVEEKEEIAKAAAAMIRDDDRIMIEAGTTCSSLVNYLDDRQGVQIVTNSVLVFNRARANTKLTITLTGGHYRPESESLVGPVAEKAITSFNARIAFLGTDGFSLERGMTTQLVEGGQVGALMSKRAEETWLLADSSKYGKAGFVSFMNIGELTGIITDSQLEREAAQRLEKIVHLTIAPKP